MGLTQNQLAGILNISFQAVSKWENNTAYPDIEMLPRLASALNTTDLVIFRKLFCLFNALLGHVEGRHGISAFGEENGVFSLTAANIQHAVRPYRRGESPSGQN